MSPPIDAEADDADAYDADYADNNDADGVTHVTAHPHPLDGLLPCLD